MMQEKHLLMRYTKTKMASLLDGYGLMTGTPENLLDVRGSICIDEDSFVYVSVGCGWFVGNALTTQKKMGESATFLKLMKFGMAYTTRMVGTYEV